MSDTEKNILIVSQDPEFAKNIRDVLPAGGDTRVSTEVSTFADMNGKGTQLAFQSDLVIFYADPDDAEEVSAIADLLKAREGHTAFMAFTNGEITIAKAQKLRDVGVDDVLPVSISQDELRSAIDGSLSVRAAVPLSQQSSGGTHTDGTIIAVSQARGGVGATTVAVNLAQSLLGSTGTFSKSQKNRIALIDMDLQFGNANVFLDLEDNGGMLQIIEGLADPDVSFMKGVMVTHSSGLDVLCAPTAVAPFYSLTPEKISAILDVLRGEYDYVIIDMPRALVDWVGPILKRASQMLIVSDTSVPCVRHARRLIDFYREDHVGLPVEIVINREDRPLLKSAHHKAVEKVLDTKLRYWLPDNPKVARKAVDLGQPVVSNSGSANLGKALRKLAQGIQDSQSAQHPNKV